MCGILGVVGVHTEEQTRAGLTALQHRGMDDWGIWSHDNVFFGHRRLSIVDLSPKGKQPMAYMDRYHITFNGEIYNFIELREILRTDGYVFTTDSDTEVVLAAYDKWGAACLNRFNGMWAFAIWDRITQELFISRDRFGKKPLYYLHTNNQFVFASEMKGLLPFLSTVKPNTELFKSKYLFTYESSSKCLIEGISRFPAGSYALLNNGVFTMHRFWNTLDTLVSVPRRYEEQQELFRSLFIDSCRLRMRTDVPLGTLLSGGLDSSSVISTMAHIAQIGGGDRVTNDWQHAFVASFPGTPLDETEYAKKVVDKLDIRATYLSIDPLSAINALFEYMYLTEDVYVTNPIPFILTYRQVKQAGISVTLDGHGADELFGGYGNDVLVSLFDAFPNIAMMQSVLHTYTAMHTSGDQSCTAPITKSFIRAAMEDRVRSYIDNHFSETLQMYQAHPQWKQLDHLNKRLFISTHISILPTLLRNYDRYSMASGVEVRMPFMDHRLVSLAFSLPWTSKVRNGYTKAIIRDSLKDLLPNEIYERKSKMGFNAPFLNWIQGPLKPFFLETVRSSEFLSSSCINAPVVRHAIEQLIQNPHATFADAEHTWRLFVPFLWEQVFIKGRKTV